MLLGVAVAENVAVAVIVGVNVKGTAVGVETWQAGIRRNEREQGSSI